jgi:hypothetical protein
MARTWRLWHRHFRTHAKEGKRCGCRLCLEGARGDLHLVLLLLVLVLVLLVLWHSKRHCSDIKILVQFLNETRRGTTG